jgi:antitoxin component YwqK of YwqJK toxin-antitoxin module
MEEGKFTAGKQVEVFRRYYDTGVMSQEKNFNMDGKEDGLVVYYYPSGKKEFEYTKDNGVTKGKATRYYPNGDVKEILMYNNDGTIGSRISKERVNPPYNEAPEVTEPSTSAPDGSKGSIKEGSRFKPNSYNKVYNSDDELWMDGEFKKGKLWDGKLYKYDSDGILLKIEVWKKGS